MSESISELFGIIIAYIVPGFIVLLALGQIHPDIGYMMQPDGKTEIAGLLYFFYGLIAMIGLGVMISGLRWMTIDQINALTGIKRPAVNHAALIGREEHLDTIKDGFYRYYQFYSNCIVSLIIGDAVLRCFAINTDMTITTELVLLGICVVLWICQRDTLKKYHHGILTLTEFYHDQRSPSPGSKRSQAQNQTRHAGNKARSKRKGQ
ncbi:MAG TPA: hypothetical protein DCM28_20885 [Phycisphaerales bacterium]|nr:hypothetical protein [Phycisphaerales bacterium]HCD31080.1 hypothetical protein [Phycisphaerales bacterium]|tara:strand:+ start:1461 stop:2081 length:621 start_codon:yes stop_codon:yes gene_type:complete